MQLNKNSNNCPVCDKFYRRKAGRALTKYCSQRCYKKARRHEYLCILHHLPKDSPYSATADLQYRGKGCEQCGNEMLPSRRLDGRIYDIAQFMRRKWCSRICSWTAMYGYDVNENLFDVFRRKIEKKKGPDECWPVSKERRGPKGYGSFYARGQLQSAYRVAYEMYNGAIPEGMLVRHTCDNPPCTNPAHLLIGTYKDNAMDRKKRGRNAKQEKFCANKMSGLTEVQYRQVLSMHEAGLDIQSIARELGVAWHTASRPLKYFGVYRKRPLGLDLESAKKVAKEYAAGGVSQEELARKYNCRQTTISRIHLRKGPYAQIDEV